MTPEQTKALIEQWDRDAAEDATSAANIVSHDGYYELDIDAVAQAFARHRLAAERRGMEWRDIASAPKDGTHILVCRFVGVLVDWARESWWQDFRGSWWMRGGHCDPTHWMPLPEPLTGEQAHDPS